MSDETTDLKAQIRDHYAERAVAATQATTPVSCCGPSSSCCGGTAVEAQDELARGLYDISETSDLPAEAVLASLGCGNPTALADLQAGEVVLDLGSGGGIDVLLSARRVGPTGKAYGLDMTDEMLALARQNQRKAGVTNVEFLKGEIEDIPLPDASVDVIISNCVINLSADKDKVLAEAFRVLKPGGRFAVSDIVFQGDVSLVPDKVMRDIEAWSGCVAGALEEQDYLDKLRRAGFADAAIEVTTCTTACPRTAASTSATSRRACAWSAGSCVPSSRAPDETRRGRRSHGTHREHRPHRGLGPRRERQGGAAASPARGGGALRARRPPAPLHAGAARWHGLLPRLRSGRPRPRPTLVLGCATPPRSGRSRRSSTPRRRRTPPGTRRGRRCPWP